MIVFHGGANPRADGVMHFTSSWSLARYYAEQNRGRPFLPTTWVWCGWFRMPSPTHLRRFDGGGRTMYGHADSLFQVPGRMSSLEAMLRDGETAIVRNVRDPHILSTVVATTESWRFRPLIRIPRPGRSTPPRYPLGGDPLA